MEVESLAECRGDRLDPSATGSAMGHRDPACGSGSLSPRFPKGTSPVTSSKSTDAGEIAINFYELLLQRISARGEIKFSDLSVNMFSVTVFATRYLKRKSSL